MIAVALLMLLGQASDAAPSFAPAPKDDWVRKPTEADMARFYPAGAAAAGYGASVMLACKVRPNGTLTDCDAKSADGPYANEFRAAALKAANIFQMTPNTAAGPAEPSTVNIPIVFTFVANALPPIRVVQPGSREGHVQVNCRVSGKGVLENCLPDKTDPGRADLYDAAFKAAARIGLPPALPSGTRILLPVHVVPKSQLPLT